MKELLAIGFWACLGLASAVGQAVWQNVNGGADLFVSMMWPMEDEGRLYVSGPFDTIGDVGAAGFAYFDGTSWKGLGAGTGRDMFGQVGEGFSLLHYKGELMSTGYFGNIPNGQEGTVHFAKWDGQAWNSLGVADAPGFLQVANDELFAVGRFDTIGGRRINHVAHWENGEWMPMAETVPFESGDQRNPLCVGYYKGRYMIGGNLRLGDGMDALIQWDGSRWSALGNGIRGPYVWVRRLAEYKGILFVGGYFWKSADNAASYVMAWDGEKWFDPFPGVTFLDQPGTMKVIDGRLYILAPHLSEDNPEMFRMVHYDGNYFCSFGNAEEEIGDICKWRGDLYGSGAYLAYHAVPNVKYIGKWIGGESTDICHHNPLPVEYLVSGGGSTVLYPNPPDRYFSLQLPDSATSCEMAVYDAAGREVMGLRPWALWDEPMDISMLPAGVYVVEVRPTTTSGTRRGQVEYIKLIKR